MSTLQFVAGLVLLVVGAEALVRGAKRLAAALGISPLVIGLTVVAFGTSAPELAVSVGSAFSGQASIAVGNVVGSNIFNVLFILGVSALVVPLVVSQQLVRLDVPLMIVLSGVVWLLALDGGFGRIDGALLVTGLVVYVVFLVRQSRRESAAVEAEYAREFGAREPAEPVNWFRDIAFVAFGLALLVLGAHWLVNAAVAFARYLEVSELVVGLTIVAAGTSLPEVVTSLVAAVRGERDIAVGNVVGSNLFNLMGVLGVTSLVAPDGVPVTSAVLGFDLPVMIAVALATLPIFFTGGVISRLEGLLLLAYYAAYTAYVVLAASQHDALAGFSAVMLLFVIPLTATGLVIVGLQELRRRRKSS